MFLRFLVIFHHYHYYHHNHHCHRCCFILFVLFSWYTHIWIFVHINTNVTLWFRSKTVVFEPNTTDFEKCWWRHIVVIFVTNSSGANWWPNLKVSVRNIIPAKNSIAHGSIVPLAMFRFSLSSKPKCHNSQCNHTTKRTLPMSQDVVVLYRPVCLIKRSRSQRMDMSSGVWTMFSKFSVTFGKSNTREEIREFIKIKKSYFWMRLQIISRLSSFYSRFSLREVVKKTDILRSAWP